MKRKTGRKLRKMLKYGVKKVRGALKSEYFKGKLNKN